MIILFLLFLSFNKNFFYKNMFLHKNKFIDDSDFNIDKVENKTEFIENEIKFKSLFKKKEILDFLENKNINEIKKLKLIEKYNFLFEKKN